MNVVHCDWEAAFDLLGNPQVLPLYPRLGVPVELRQVQVQHAQLAWQAFMREASQRLRGLPRDTALKQRLSEGALAAALAAAGPGGEPLRRWVLAALPGAHQEGTLLAWVVLLRHALGMGRPEVPVLPIPSGMASVLPYLKELVDFRKTQQEEEHLSEVGLPPDLLDMALAAGRCQRATTALAFLHQEVGEDVAEEFQNWVRSQAAVLGIPEGLLVWPPNLPHQ